MKVDDFISFLKNEQGWYHLLEADEDLSSVMIQAYNKVEASDKKEIILLAWEKKPPNWTVLEVALKSKTKILWQAAIDGLVALGELKSEQLIKLEMGNRKNKNDLEFIEWAVEALEQIGEG